MNRLDRYRTLRNPYRDHLIIQPLMTGGRILPSVQERLIDERWLNVGYANCYDCLEGRSSLIGKPPIREFLADIAAYFGGDTAEHTFGCRAAQHAVMKTIRDTLDEADHAETIVADPLCHYTTAIAAEANGFHLIEPPHTGYPEYRVDPDGFVERIEAVKAQTGKLPALIVMTHVEPYYGNVNPVDAVGRIAQDYEIPYMVNAAYTAGVLPINMKDLHADFLTVSSHKSMASLGPLGHLVTNYAWSKKVFRSATIHPSWSGRGFGKKLPTIFGCSIGGIPLISAIYAFPHVAERSKRWAAELEKTRWLIDELETIPDVMLLGERPHRHHLVHFETPRFWEISQRHKRRGFFLADEMIKRGIVGLHRGLSKHVKLSVYGLPWDDVRRVRDAFHDIVDQYRQEAVVTPRSEPR
jgi:Sep-tRNA:Cys-tRNA synthetase